MTARTAGPPDATARADVLPAGPRLRCLVIDDHPEIAQLIRRVAEGSGFEVCVTTDAEAFKAEYDRIEPALLLLDLQMPGMDGIELLRFLADRSSRARIAIISGVDRRVLDAAHRLGKARGLSIIGTLQKPMRLADLRGLLAAARD